MLKRIVLDVQHSGQPHKPHDRGACYKEFREADLTLKYAALAFQQLTNLGYEAFLVTSGTYQERHEWINRHDIELHPRIRHGALRKKPASLLPNRLLLPALRSTLKPEGSRRRKGDLRLNQLRERGHRNM